MDKTKKCGDCVYFRYVKILRKENGGVETSFGECEKSKSDELISAEEPACNDYLEEKYDIWFVD